MPEWPDLFVLRERLERACAGRTVAGAEVHNGTVLRAAQPLASLLLGRTLAAVEHRGKFLAFHWDDGGLLIVSPMLTGLFALLPAAARLHPKRKVTSLSDAELAALYAAVRETVAAAVAAVAAGTPAALGVKVRDHMQVRGREGKPCPRCGTRIVLRHLGYMEVNFCPGCQKAPAGQIY